MDKLYLSEPAFEKIFMYLSKKKGVYCKNRCKTRKFLEAVYHIMKTRGDNGLNCQNIMEAIKVSIDGLSAGQRKISGARCWSILRTTAIGNPS